MTTVTSDTTPLNPASELITHVKMTVFHRLRQLARRNQRIIVATQYLVGASTFLLPLRAANYELYTEASYSLSQLIAFFNNILLNHGESQSNSIDMQYVLWFVTRTVCHLEVFLEKFSLVLWGEQAKSLIVLAIELAKAISRLILLLRRRREVHPGSIHSPTMLIGWAREYPSIDDGDHGGVSSDFMDLAQYSVYYQQGHIDAFHRQKQRLSQRQMVSGSVSNRGTRYHHDDDENDELSLLIRHRSPLPYNTITTSPLTGPDDCRQEVGCFVGRRSGMVLLSPVSTDRIIHASTSKQTPKSPTIQRMDDNHNIGGMDGITPLHGTSMLATTPTPKRMTKWDQTWDDDDESQTMTLTPLPFASLPSNSVRTHQVLTSSSGAIVNGQGEHHAQHDDSGLLLPLTHALHREGRGSPETEGSTDADSFDSNKEGMGEVEGDGGGREMETGRGGNGKKGWVVWSLQGSDDHEHQLLAPRLESSSSSSSSSSSLPTHDSNSSSDSSTAVVNSSSTSAFPFTAEQALLFAELLYILRPVVHAWAMHYVTTNRLKSHRRRRDGRSHDTGGDSSMNTDNTFHDRAGGGGGAASQGSSGVGQSQLRLRLPLLEDMVAWALCLMMEVASVQLTAIALRMKREEAIHAASQAVKEENDDNIQTDISPSNHLIATASLPSHAFDRELSRRRMALFYYLVRSPVFDRATLPLLQSAAQILHYIPILNALPGHAISMLSYLHRSHFRSAAST